MLTQNNDYSKNRCTMNAEKKITYSSHKHYSIKCKNPSKEDLLEIKNIIFI